MLKTVACQFLLVAGALAMSGVGCAETSATSNRPAPAVGQRVVAKETSLKYRPDVKISPMLLLRAAERDRLKKIVTDDKAARELLSPWRLLADEAMKTDPSPIAEIVYEGRVEADPERDKTKVALRDMELLRGLLYVHAATGEVPYLNRARTYTLSWIRTVRPTGNPINMNKLDALWMAYLQIRDARVWSRDEQAEVEKFLRQVSDAIIKDAGNSNKGNWHSKRIKLVGASGFLLNDAVYRKWAGEGYRAYVKDNIAPDGQTYDFKHRDSLSYHTGGVTPLLEIAIAARMADEDLYGFATSEGASVRSAVAFLLPYARGEKIHPQWVNSKEKFDRIRWESGDPKYEPGKPWDRKAGQEMLELAAFFDSSLLPLVSELAENKNRYGSWTGVLAAAASSAKGKRTDAAANQ